jgi:hypothetical protein
MESTFPARPKGKRATRVLARKVAGTTRAMVTKKKTVAAKKKQAPAGKPSRAYSPGAGDYVEQEVHEMEAGKLRSGTSGKKVTNRKQAIAIGLSEARRHGEKVPKPKRAPRSQAT